MTTDTTGAGSETKVDDPKQDVAQPAGESQGKEEDFVPKKQFLAALNNANTKYEALEREVKELRAASTAKQEPKPATLAELRKYVAAGEITQDQADALWEKQIVEKAKRESLAEVDRTLGAQTTESRVNEKLLGYKELVPAAWENGSPEWTKAANAYKELVSTGSPANKATELAALLATFGDLAALRTSRSARPGPADAHVETGGGKPADTVKKDVLKNLTPQQKAYYDKGIESGRYKDWEAVRAELKYARRK